MTTIIIADHDDPDVEALRRHPLMMGMVWLQLSLEPSEYDIRYSVNDVVMRGGTVELDQSDIRAANRVLFRRWRVAPPAPPVTVPDRRSSTGAVVEREWASAMNEIFSTWWEINPTAFSRRPDIYPGRLTLMRQLAGVVDVPTFEAATQFALPPQQAGLVTKLISTDQSFGDGQRATTIDADPSALQARQPCPTLVQTCVEGATELRVAYAFGQVGAVAQTQTGDSPTRDIRIASSVKRTALDPDARLREEASRVAAATGLACFTADVLVDASGDVWWLDVNPDGLFIAADSAERNLIDCLAAGLGG